MFKPVALAVVWSDSAPADLGNQVHLMRFLEVLKNVARAVSVAIVLLLQALDQIVLNKIASVLRPVAAKQTIVVPPVLEDLLLAVLVYAGAQLCSRDFIRRRGLVGSPLRGVLADSRHFYRPILLARYYVVVLLSLSSGAESWIVFCLEEALALYD